MHSSPPVRTLKSQLAVENHPQEDSGAHSKKIPHIQSCLFNKMVRGAQIQNKSRTRQVGNQQTGKQYYKKSSPTVVKVLSLLSSFPACGSGKETGNPQGIWLDFHRTVGEKDSILKGDKQNLACTMSQWIGAVTRQETEPDLPAKVGVSCGGMGQQWLALQSGH